MSVAGEFKTCPFCREEIRDEAVKCHFCGEWLEEKPTAAGMDAASQPVGCANGTRPERRSEGLAINPSLPPGQVIFFPVSALKLVVMATVTFGIYQIYWFYKNWKLVKQQTASDIIPFWRSLFALIFCYWFFKLVKEVATFHRIPFRSSPGILAITWIILELTWRLPHPYWILCWLTPLILVPVQNAVNRVNAVLAPLHNRNSRFSGWNIAGIVVGGILVVLSLIGAFLA